MRSKHINRKQGLHIVLFLSRATPLARWQAMGIVKRELAVYRGLAQQVEKVSIVSSGSASEVEVLEAADKLEVLYNRWDLSPNLYSVLAPFLHWKSLRSAVIYKTNQMDGAWTAILSGWVHGKPVVVRAGYLWAEDNRSEGGAGIKAYIIDRLQRFSFRNASAIFLTTEAMKQHITKRYSISFDDVHVVPNYVDTAHFQAVVNKEPIARQICFIGRLHPRKNLDLLIKATATISGATLVLAGQGEDKSRLERIAKEHQVSVIFLGVVEHTELPKLIQQSEIFVLASQFEGHPKALIEAMACGAAVVGTDVSGINNVVVHEETGLLCPPTINGIRSAIQRLIENNCLRQRLGNAAREFAASTYGLDRIVSMELELYAHLLKDLD